MRLFEEAIVSGDMSGDMAVTYAYGLYLANGGKPDDFQDFSTEDIQIMLSSYVFSNKKRIIDVAKLFLKSDE